MDPAAFGTAMIGIEHIRREESLAHGVARSGRPRPRPVHVRELVANLLRRTAERIAPAPAPA